MLFEPLAQPPAPYVRVTRVMSAAVAAERPATPCSCTTWSGRALSS